jgi:tRNA nucleotidyltransferase/poly(A) polymerase
MARQERYPKPASKPQIQPGTIHDDLRCRDFTVNAIALSLGKASRGLLLDPTNGLGDLHSKELRAVTNHSLWDDPSRLLRIVRLRTRLGFTVDERTAAQSRAVREAKLEAKITPAVLAREIRQIAFEPAPGEVLKALEEEKLLSLLSPALGGAKLNLTDFQKWQKVRQSLPFGLALPVNSEALFFSVLLDKLTPKERAQVNQTAGLEKEQIEAAAKLESRAARVERELAAAKIARPSALYDLLANVPGEILVLLLMRSGQRIVLDRIKNFLQKYLPMAQEVTDSSLLEQGLELGTPKFLKMRHQMIVAKLNARPKKVPVEEPPPPPAAGPGRRSATFARS